MVQLCVHFLKSRLLGESEKIDIRCFTCPWFRRNVSTSPEQLWSHLRLPIMSAPSVLYFKVGRFLSHTEYTFRCRKNQENNKN